MRRSSEEGNDFEGARELLIAATSAAIAINSEQTTAARNALPASERASSRTSNSLTSRDDTSRDPRWPMALPYFGAMRE